MTKVKTAVVQFNHPEYNFKEFTLTNGEKWKLVGECNQCGECCKQLVMKHKDLNDGNDRCKHIKDVLFNGEQITECDFYWHRPMFCAIFPNNPYEELPKECSFEWERIK